jgi:peptidoglycan/LPS O-acetylase OafA/YrhL
VDDNTTKEPQPFKSSQLQANQIYRPDIDGLRAIAVIMVVAFHTFPDLVKSGFVGLIFSL